MQRLRPGAFNQDCVCESSGSLLKCGRVEALHTPSTAETETCIDVATATMPRTAMAPLMSPAYVVVHEKTGQSDEAPRANWPQPRKV